MPKLKLQCAIGDSLLLLIEINQISPKFGVDFFYRKKMLFECQQAQQIFQINNIRNMQKDCYFCQELDLISCLTKSLYNKHNDVPDKRTHIIDTLVDVPRTNLQQQESLNSKRKLLRYKEILHMNDDHQNIAEYLQNSDKELQELLEYYKYRIYVPLFRKSACADTIHCYYYEKLKLYYNGIKRQLNMSVIDSQQSCQIDYNRHPTEDGQYAQEFGYDNDFIKNIKRNKNGQLRNQIINKKQANFKQKKNSNLLKGITIQEDSGIRTYETESKALQNLVKLLKKNQKFKKVQTLKTQDCEGINQLKGTDQRITFPIYEFSKKGRYDAASTAYIKYKLVAKSKTKPNTNVSNQKSYKKSKDYQTIDNLRKKSTESTKIPHKQTSLRCLRSKENKLLLQNNSKNSFMKDQKQIYRLIDRNQGIRITRYGSMPKVTMKFEGKTMRSSSTSKIEGIYQRNIAAYTSNLNSSKKMANLSPYKQTITKNEKAAVMIQANQIRSTMKKVRAQSQWNSNRKQTKEAIPKDKQVINTGFAKKIKANGFEIDTSDNIINIRKKKLQALKVRSDQKKIN